MIRITERVIYLPKDKKNAIPPINQMANDINKEILKDIKKKIKTIKAGSNEATVTLSGSVSNRGGNNINISVSCSDPTLKNQIDETLKQYYS